MVAFDYPGEPQEINALESPGESQEFSRQFLIQALNEKHNFKLFGAIDPSQLNHGSVPHHPTIQTISCFRLQGAHVS